MTFLIRNEYVSSVTLFRVSGIKQLETESSRVKLSYLESRLFVD